MAAEYNTSTNTNNKNDYINTDNKHSTQLL